MSDLVGNPEDRFSHNEAQILEDNSGSLCFIMSLLLQILSVSIRIARVG